MRARRLAFYGLAALFGIVLGAASALYLSGLWPGAKPLDFGNVEIDGWRSDFAIGSEAADPYTRARVARHGLLGLAKTEAVYFARTTDEAGRRLVANCDYRLTGGAMPAAWWSITLYDADSMLPLNQDEALSVDATSIVSDSERWMALISSTRPRMEPNWISSSGAENFDLTLRLYVPDKALLEDPGANLTPPVIERIACREEAS